jgi:hypothetical protein
MLHARSWSTSVAPWEVRLCCCQQLLQQNTAGAAANLKHGVQHFVIRKHVGEVPCNLRAYVCLHHRGACGQPPTPFKTATLLLSQPSASPPNLQCHFQPSFEPCRPAGVSFSPDAAEAVAASMAAGTWSGPVQVHSLGRAAKSRFRQQLEAAAEADEGRCGGPVDITCRSCCFCC